MADIEEHDCYAILYEDKDDYYDESELHLGGDENFDKDENFERYVSRAESLKSEGHRNVRVIEYVIVTREVASV